MRRWLDVPTSETTSLADYAAADRGQVPDGPPPQLPSEIYSLAFRLRHGGSIGEGAASAANEEGASTSEINDLCEYVPHFRTVCTGQAQAQEQVPQAPPVAPESNAEQGALERVSSVTTPHKRSGLRKKSRGGKSTAPALGMCGFTADECGLLLAQGCKPWDEDAETVLRALMEAP